MLGLETLPSGEMQDSLSLQRWAMDNVVHLLTLFPNVSLFYHGLQKHHITVHRTLQNNPLTYNKKKKQ